MDLPLEIVNNVLQRLSKKDLKELRLVRVSLVSKVSPFLFDTVFISMDPQDLMNAQLALGMFSSSIKTIILSPVEYEPLTKGQYRDRVEVVKGATRCPRRSRFNEHMKSGYREYCDVQERASQPDCQERMLSLFETALRSAPRLRKVIITHRRRNTDLTGPELAKSCRDSQCGMPAEMHAMFRLSPFHSHERLRSPDLGAVLQMALAASGPKMTELVMEPDVARCQFKATIDSFVHLGQYMPYLGTSISKLTKIRLDIDALFHDPDVFRMGVIAKQLFCAVNLQHLFLEVLDGYWQFPDPARSMFHSLLNNCRFPKLETLVLSSCQMEGDELLVFLGASPGLRDLVLYNCELRGYTWRDLIERIKVDTRLDVLIMDLLHLGGIGIEGQYPPHRLLCYCDCAGDVENYYFRDGPNPFDANTLEKYVKKWSPNKRWGNLIGKGREYIQGWHEC